MNLTFPGGSARILGASAVAVNAPADTNENILATITIPAGAMGLNGIIRFVSDISCTNNVNAKTMRLRFSGIGGTVLDTTNMASVGARTQSIMIFNRGVANSQRVIYYTNNQTIYPTSSAVDTSVATTLVLTMVKATAGDTVTLESYLAELILP